MVAGTRWRRGDRDRRREAPSDLIERPEDAVAQRAVERLGEVPLARRVLDQQHLAGTDAPALAVARGDLDAGVEIDDVLPPRRGVPVEIVVRRDLAEDDARGRQPRRQPPGA